MARSKVARLSFHILVGVATLPFVQSSAQAIVINDTAGRRTARRLGAQFTAVTDIFFEGESDCTGSLISPSYVLTAQHCVSGFNFTYYSVGFRDSDRLNTLIEDIPLTRIFEIGDDNLLDGTDIAILELSRPAPGSIRPLRFISDTDQLVGSTVTTVGFGLNGVGSVGHQGTADGRRWAARNVLDWAGAAADINGTVRPGSDNILSTDFDDGASAGNTLSDFGSSAHPRKNEGTTAPGDSGGPLLVKRNQEYLIAGVLSGGTTNDSVFGDISWWTGTERHRTFIEDFGGQFVGNWGGQFVGNRSGQLIEGPGSQFVEGRSDEYVDVPEPNSTLVLLALSIVGAGAIRNRKRLRADHT